MAEKNILIFLIIFYLFRCFFLILPLQTTGGTVISIFARFIFMVSIIYAMRVPTLLRCLFVSLPFLFLTTKVSAKEDGMRFTNDYVLIINSHTESTSWSNNIISPVLDHVSANGLDVFTEHMNVMVLDKEILLSDFQEYLFDKYKTKPPRLLILLDNSTILLKEGLKKYWNDIPIILCAEQDFVGPPDSYFKKDILAPEDRIPLSDFLGCCNLTFLHTPVYLKENIELMRYVIPNMKKLIFVVDGKPVNQQLNWELSRLMKEEYGQIKYESFSAESMNTDELIEELSCVDSFTTGVLFSSWVQTSQIVGNTMLLANSHKIFAANSAAPLFSLRYVNIKNDGMIGGYIFDHNVFNQKLLATITEVLNGVDPRNIPFYYPSDAAPTFNYATLLQKGLSVDVCPAKSQFIAMPPTFLQKNKSLILACLFALAGFIYFLIQQNRIRSFRRVQDAQQKLKDTNDKLTMVLGVANILSWKWDIENKTIYYDLNKEIDAKYPAHDEQESFSLAEEQYFSQIADEDRDMVWEAYESIKNGLVEKINMQFRVNRFNGELNGEYWVEAHAAVATWDKKKNPQSIIGSLLNITERKKMEEALVLEKERAEESSRFKAAFLANISHEIRTPLNAIVGFSTILLSTEDEEEKLEYIDLIEKNNELLLQLISDIIDLSKIETESLDFNYSNTEVNDLMRELEKAISPKINGNKIALIFEPGLPICYLHTDRGRLAQLLLNMLTNAAKFTAEGSIRFGYEKRGNILYFYVSDTGCGIPIEKQQAVFKRFVKLDDFSQGTGLGLSICQVIAQQMGGEIGVESEEGKGSTFWFTLPYCEPTATK